MPTRPTALVTRRLPPDVEARLAVRTDARLNPDDAPLPPEALARALGEADVVLCTLGDRLDRATFDAAAARGPIRARLLANFGVGTNHIDLDAARAHGLAVTNTPGMLTDDTADVAIALLLVTMRRLHAGERELRAGAWSGWRPTHHPGVTLTGKTLGIVGFGRIGQAVARRAHLGLGMRVRYVSRRARPEDAQRDAARDAALGAEPCASLDELLATSDAVSLHCPATPETRHLIDAAALARMRPDAVLVNTARGDVVDEAALVEALAARRIAAAGLDVFEHEPRLPPGLLALDNVVLVPHLGSATVETRRAMGMRAVENVEAWLDGRPLPDRVA